MKKFTHKEVVEILEVNPNTLQVWLRDGLIIPSIANPKGRGATRLYSAADLTQIKIISILSQFSYNRTIVKNLCDLLHGKIPSSNINLAALAKKNPHIPAFKQLADIKENLLNPFLKRTGPPIILKLSDNKWDEIGPGFATAIPGNSTVVLIINVSRVMDEIKKKVKK